MKSVQGNLLEVAINSQKYLLDDYINEMETYLNNKIDMLNDTENKLIAIGNIPNLEAFYDDHDTDYYHFSKAFPSILRSSVVILLYSNFEHYLNKFCECQCYERKLTIKYSDIDGNGIYRTTKYLKLLCGLNLGISKYWSELEYYNKIRNALVHTNGLINEKKINKSKVYLAKQVELENTYTDANGDTFGKLKFNTGSLEYFNELIHVFMKEIFKQLWP
jgi:hypothetical protein